jgi:hypothetical protein
MTESQWNTSESAIAMLEFAFDRQGIRSDSSRHRMGYCMNSGAVEVDSTFETTMHRFYVACCRRIWRLLPDQETQKGVEVAEQWLDGNTSDSELDDRDYHVEGAAFGIDYKSSPDELNRWISCVDAIPESELVALLGIQMAERPDSYELLKSAAYFAHYAIMYPAMNPKGVPPQSYHQFLSAHLLRQHMQYAA